MKFHYLILVLIVMASFNTDVFATVNILVSTYDGIVVATDSRVTLADSSLSRIASDTYQKLFQVGKYTGVSCSGAAFLINDTGHLRSIGSIVSEFAATEGISDTSRIYPTTCAENLKDYLLALFRTRAANLTKGKVNLLVFGYETNGKRRIFNIIVPIFKHATDGNLVIDARLTELFSSGVPCTVLRGQNDVYTRLIKGYDPSLLKKSYFDSIKSDLDQLRYDIRYDLMSLQDAIDFAVFIVRATIEAQRFNQNSIMGVGGVIDLSVVTPEGFKWIQKKKFTVEGMVIDK